MEEGERAPEKQRYTEEFHQSTKGSIKINFIDLYLKRADGSELGVGRDEF